MSGINDGLTAWQMTSNHNHMVDFQRKTTASSEVGVEIAYFAHSAIRITSPSGLSVMLDPWRNHPGGSSFFFHDFPKLRVDIGICTHAHFDHDALHRLDAHVLIDRLIGQYIFADMKIFGIADKHATDFSATTYDIGRLIKEFQGVDIRPPDNPRSWDNCLVIVETGDLRMLHWGYNRADLPETVWDMLGDIDILFLPLDDSQHVISYEMADAIMARLKPSITVPTHYYIWNITQRQSTLFSPEQWLRSRSDVIWLNEPVLNICRRGLDQDTHKICYFGEHVAFDVKNWHDSDGYGG